MSLNFKKSACYDDVINVKTQLKNTPTAKIEFEYEITDEDGKIITTATTVLAFIDMKTKRPVRAPQYILDLLEN
jgi:acyl-CoA thioester hydrolase